MIRHVILTRDFDSVSGIMDSGRHPSDDGGRRIYVVSIGAVSFLQIKGKLNMLGKFWNDENGFIVSAEMVLIATICVIGLIAGLVEVQFALVGELNDVSDAIGSLNQSYQFAGFTSFKSQGQNGNCVKSQVAGSMFVDTVDECDNNQCTLGCDSPMPENPKW